MEEELKSMSMNKVWDLVDIPEGAKKVGCKWVYKTYDFKRKKTNGLKQDLWLRDSHREKESIIQKPSRRSQRKTHSESLWLY